MHTQKHVQLTLNYYLKFAKTDLVKQKFLHLTLNY